MKTIGIIGCGWLGFKLAQRLPPEGAIYATTRTQERANELASYGYSLTVIDFSEEKENVTHGWDVLSLLDVVIVSVPFSMRKSTPESLRFKMRNVCLFIGGFKGQLFFTSTTGVYPRKRIVFSEDDLPVEENAIENQLKLSYPNTNILRLGGLMGDDRLLSKYAIQNTEDPVNHVHFEDVCAVIIEMIKRKVQGKLYNVVAPLHPSKKEVVAAQRNEPFSDRSAPTGRIISSSKLESEMGIAFKYPDPRTFHK